MHDLLGFNTDFRPKFVRTWMEGASGVHEALQAFHAEVREGTFPGREESYS